MPRNDYSDVGGFGTHSLCDILNVANDNYYWCELRESSYDSDGEPDLLEGDLIFVHWISAHPVDPARKRCVVARADILAFRRRPRGAR